MSTIRRLLVPLAASVVAFLGLGPAGTGLHAQVAATSLNPASAHVSAARPGDSPRKPLQFSSSGHVLAFSPDGVVTAAADHALKVDFVGSRLVAPDAASPAPGALNRVTYRHAWEGVSVVYEAAPGAVSKSTYHLEAGAAVRDIRLRYSRPVRLDAQGNLVIAYERGTLTEAAPVAWQEIGGQRRPVTVAYELRGGQDVGFAVGPHEAGLPLVIDPLLTWNAFLGGAADDQGQAVAVDGTHVYVTGKSAATWGSPLRAYDSNGDAFVAKLTLGGTLVWNTFLGGTGADYGVGIAVDGDGNTYITGNSTATWQGGTAPKRAFLTSGDAFVAKLNAAGALQWNTFLGAIYTTYGGIAVASGSTPSIFVAGTSSAAWGSPVREFGSSAATNAFAAKLDNDGVLLWNTFLGGSTVDHAGTAVAVDSLGSIYVAGTSSAVWGTAPVRTHAGGTDAFAARLGSDGSLTWNTFLGGTGADEGLGIAVDSSQNVILVGNSGATWGTAPVRAFLTGPDAFAAQLTSSGAMAWNTFLGGAGTDNGCGVAVDAAGNVFVTGYSLATWGTPTRAFTAGASDTFVARLDTTGALAWNTFLGGSGDDPGYGIALGAAGRVFVTGYSDASWGDTITRAYTAGGDAGRDAFVAQVVDVTLAITPNPVSPIRTGASVTFTASATGAGLSYEYAFYWYNPATLAFELQRAYSTTATWTPAPVLTPSAVGRKTLLVYTRVAGSTRPYDAFTYLEYIVAPAAATAVTLTASPEDHATQGTPVVFTADASGSASYANYSHHYQYQFLTSYDSGTTWSVKRNWSASSTWTMPGTTPLTPGITPPWKVKVNVRTITTAGAEATATIDYELDPAHDISVTLTASPATSANVGTAVTFTAAGAGASAPFYYQFWFYNRTRWDVVQDWSTTATWNLPTETPEGTGYKVQVRASKLAAGPWEAWAELPYAITVVPTPATGLTLTASAPTPHIEGSAVTFRGTASGGGPTYYYAFYWSTTGGAPWTLKQAWSTTATWIMPDDTPTGNYRIRVETRTGATAEQLAEMNYQVITALGTVTLSPSVASPQVQGTEVTFTAAVTGSPAGCSYQFWRSYDNEVSWVLKQDWSTTNSWLMPSTTPLTPTGIPYRIKVIVSLDGGTSIYATSTISFQLTAATTLTVTLVANPATSVAYGTAATFTANATAGPGSPILYQFWFYNGSRWDMIPVAGVTHGWSTTNTYTLPAGTAVGSNYKVQVRVTRVPIETVKQLDWQAYANVSYAVKVPPATSLTVTASKPSPQYEGTTGITFTASAEGGIVLPNFPGPITYYYAFYWYNESTGTYDLRQAYSTDNTWDLPADTPETQPGHSSLLVYVRTSTSSGFDLTSYTAYQIVAPRATAVSLAASPGSPQVQGTAVTFTATATPDDITTYQYRFWLSFDGGLTWTLKQDWAYSNVWVMGATTPLTPTGIAHVVKVDVRSSPASTVPDTSGTRSFQLNPPVAPEALSVALSANPGTTVTQGTAITFTATGTGGTKTEGTPDPQYLYQFWFYNGTRWDMVPVAGVDHGWSPTIKTYVVPGTTLAGSAYKVQVRITQVPLASVTKTSWQAWANQSFTINP